MNRLLPQCLCLTGLSMVGFTTVATAVKPPRKSKPNIIIIMTDQQTASAMSCTGNTAVYTPAMDALAADGVNFTRAYCPFPLSGPSRASIFTGRMPVSIGATDNAVPIDPQAMRSNLGFALQNAGYRTLYAGKWHIPEIDIPEGVGFTPICGMGDGRVVDHVAEYLRSDSDDRPMLLVASFLDPHEICEAARSETLPYGAIEVPAIGDCPMLPANFMPSTYEPEAIRLYRSSSPRSHPTDTYTQDDWRRYLYTYYRLVERVDREVGRLVALLRERGLYDDSLIIFCSDHGDGIAAHGWNQKWVLFEEVINVPLVIKPPKGTASVGRTDSTTLSNIGLDIYSTVCDYAGLLPATNFEGISLRASVTGKNNVSSHSEIFVETLLPTISTRGWAVVEQNYKYVLYTQFRNREQLFDLSVDSGEMVNLAVDNAHAEELQRMREKLYRWGVSHDDAKLIKALKPLVEQKSTIEQ